MLEQKKSAEIIRNKESFNIQNRELANKYKKNHDLKS